MSVELEYGMDFREPEYRREVFLRFYQFHTEFKLHPGLVYLLIPYMRKRLDWNLEQLLWFCFINGKKLGRPKSTVDREEILKLRVRGLSLRQIASTLGVGYGTVRTRLPMRPE